MSSSQSAAERRQLGMIFRSVVKVIAVSDPPDYDQPWQTRGTTNSIGSGAIVRTSQGLRVLTNAHCVEDAVFVEVRRYGNARRFVASVQAVGHECDLALLEVEDPEFFSGTVPIPVGELPQLSDRVSVCGFPVGGERLSITEGVVSRIEIVRYAQRRRRLLAVQIDAAINAGNSGGPVLMADRMVGVAFQALEDADQIGYMIAPPVITHFLEDLEDGVADGFPSIGIRYQPLESSAHRRSLGLPDSLRDGILVARIVYGGTAWGVLREGDVLLSIDGVPIASDGTFEFRDGEQLTFDYIISRRQVGETLEARVWRDGAEVRCVLPLKAPQYFVSARRYDVKPSYYVFGGLLFVPLSSNYLRTWGENWWSQAPRDLVALYENGVRTRERHEPVVLQKVLADRINQGYHTFESILIDAVNGRTVRSLAHLVELVEGTNEPYVEFRADSGLRFVIDRGAAVERRDVILQRFGVRADRSPDLDCRT